MSVAHPRFTTRIAGDPETIFELIADMRNYGRWLPNSSVFGGTTEVTPYPVRLGTTYLDVGPAGERPGSVTEYDPPTRITFHHTMVAKRGPLTANMDVHVRYTVERDGDATRVTRALDITIDLRRWQKVARPVIASAFRRESLRTLAALKRFVEAPPDGGRAS